MEIGNAPGGRVGADGGDEGAPELRVHMLGCVDAIPIDTEPVDPAFVNVDEARDDARIFSGKIIETDEIAILRALAAPVGIAPVMIIYRVVEPGGKLDRFLALGDDRRIGKGWVVQLCPIAGICILIPGKSYVDRRSCHAAFARKGIVRLVAINGRGVAAFLILDHIGCMIGDDVHIDLHAACMRRLDQGLEIGVGPKMRVHAREVRHPIAMIAGAFLSGAALYRLVLENRRQPDGGRAQPLDIVQLGGQALEIPAMIESA